jgi:hypothetical protein
VSSAEEIAALLVGEGADGNEGGKGIPPKGFFSSGMEIPRFLELKTLRASNPYVILLVSDSYK